MNLPPPTLWRGRYAECDGVFGQCGSSRFESLILSHHSRYKVTGECHEEDINNDDDDVTDMVSATAYSANVKFIFSQPFSFCTSSPLSGSPGSPKINNSQRSSQHVHVCLTLLCHRYAECDGVFGECQVHAGVRLTGILRDQ